MGNRPTDPKLVASHEQPKPFYPFCRVCGWRTYGVDSWDGMSCKCKHPDLEKRRQRAIAEWERKRR